MRPIHARTVALVASLIVVPAATARAQSAPRAPADNAPVVLWRMASGYGWFASRDVARTGRPLDASPVAWSGRGLTIEAERTRLSPGRMHRVGLAGSLIGRFHYRSPVTSVERPSADRYRALEGVYEYRRYPFVDWLLRGLDVGIGFQGQGRYATTARHVGDDISARETVLDGGIGVVAAARVRRWARVQGEVAWVNGLVVARLREHHSESATQGGQSGGGWLTHLTAAASIGLTSTTAIAARYAGARDGLFSSHRHAVLSRGSLTLGVTYEK